MKILKTKILFVMVVALILVSMSVNVLAQVGYMPGPQTYTLSSDDYDLTFLSSESKEYNFYLPFDAVSITVAYSVTNDVTMQIQTGVQSESFTLSAGEYTYTHTFAKTERKGEKKISFTSSGAADITEIIFNKAQVTKTILPIRTLTLTTNEEAIQSSVLMMENSRILLVNGARRYIDYNNTSVAGEMINGRFCLPIATLSRALGYYYEDMPEKHYVFMRHDNVEFCFTDTISYMERFVSYQTPEKENIPNPVVYKNGKTYLPVRYFAEIIGKTVGYRDGVVVVDDKFSVARILADESLLAYVKGKFDGFTRKEVIGKTYYVSQNDINADDSNDGSINAPWKTISKAANTVRAGETVIIKEGIYREVLMPTHSGTAYAPITFKAAEGADVVLSATEEVSGFTHAGNGVYTASVDWDLGKGRNQVFYGEESLIEARYPDVSAPEYSALTETADGYESLGMNWPIRGDLHLDTLTDTSLVRSETLLKETESNYWKGGIFVGSFGHAYELGSAIITGSQQGGLTVEAQETTDFDNSASSEGWSFGSIVGHINCLSVPNEWILQDGTLHVIPPTDVDGTQMKLEVKKRQLVADLSRNKFVRLQGLKTIGGGILMRESEMCVIDNCEILYNNHFIYDKEPGLGFDSEDAFRGQNGAPYKGEMGIYIGGSDNVLVNNRIKWAAGPGIYGVGKYAYIENNVISDCGYSGLKGSIYFDMEAWKPENTLRGGHGIYANTVYNAGRSVLMHRGTEKSTVQSYLPEEIAFNDFHGGIISSLDAGITNEYMVNMGTEKLKTKYHHNYVYHTMKYSNPYSFGIYHDGATQWVDTYNNLVFVVSEGAQFTFANIYTQLSPIAYSDCDTWNNSEIYRPVTGGPDSLTADDFPDEKPFYAGAKHGEYLVNYNHIVKDTSLGESSTYYVSEPEIGQTQTFTVDCGTMGSNRFTIGFLGDKYNNEDVATITIGGVSYPNINLTTRASQESQLNFVTVSTPLLKGTQTLTVTPTTVKSAAVVSVKPQHFRQGNGTLNASLVYGGLFDSYQSSSITEPPRISYQTGAHKPTVDSIYADSWVMYEDVVFDENVTTFQVLTSVPYGNEQYPNLYGNQPVQVYINSLDGEQITAYQTGNYGSNQTITVPLDRTLPAGTYDIYIKFGRNSLSTGFGKCSVAWFKFY